MIPADAWPEWADRHCWDEDGGGWFYGSRIRDEIDDWEPSFETSGIPLPPGHDWRVPVMRYQPVQAIGRDRLLAIIDAQNACPFPVPAWARWVAQDTDGEWWAYASEPWVCSGDEGIVCDTRPTVERLVEYYRNPDGLATAVTENPVAWMVAGRLEQGLSFDKRAAETMAFANCGEVVPLYASPQPSAAIDLLQQAADVIREQQQCIIAGRHAGNLHAHAADVLALIDGQASPKGGSDALVWELLPDGWTMDCQGKQDYDARLAALSCRYYPPNYSAAGLHSATASILAGNGSRVLAAKEFTSGSEVDVKAQVEVWAAGQVAALIIAMQPTKGEGE